MAMHPKKTQPFPLQAAFSTVPGRRQRVKWVPGLLLGLASGTSSTRSAVCSGDASWVLLGHCTGRQWDRKGWGAAHIPEDGVGTWKGGTNVLQGAT